jgi:hypothetical protein
MLNSSKAAMLTTGEISDSIRALTGDVRYDLLMTQSVPPREVSSIVSVSEFGFRGFDTFKDSKSHERKTIINDSLSTTSTLIYEIRCHAVANAIITSVSLCDE